MSEYSTSFEAPKLTGVSQKIAEAFKKAVEEGIKDGVPDAEKLKKLGLDLDEKLVNNIAEAGGVKKYVAKEAGKRAKIETDTLWAKNHEEELRARSIKNLSPYNKDNLEQYIIDIDRESEDYKQLYNAKYKEI